MGMVGASNTINNTSYFLVECEGFEMKLHVFYTQNIKSLQVIDFKGYFCNVTIEWE
jgi:hypothetical protein